MKYKKRPLIVEAIQFTGENKNVHKILCWANTEHVNVYHQVSAVHQLKIDTLDGIMTASVGDWIIKGIDCEFYPCKDIVFKETYDEVELSD